MTERQKVSTPSPDICISRTETSRLLGVTGRTIDYHARNNRINPIRSGKNTFFLLTEIQGLHEYLCARSGKVAGKLQPKEAVQIDGITRKTVSQEDLAPDTRTLNAILGEYQRQEDMRHRELSGRLHLLEQLVGVAGRGVGLNRPTLIAIAEEVIRKNQAVEHMTEDEKELWMQRIAAMDYQTVKYCLATPEISNIPIWLLRLGIKISSSRPTQKDKNSDLLHCRNLRILLQSFAPPKPIYYCSFPIPPALSAIDGLILASHCTV